MCIELSIDNKIFLNKVKSKISKKIDKFNESMVRMIEKFDTKYNELGEKILNEFNKFKSKNSYSYQQSRGYSNVPRLPDARLPTSNVVMLAAFEKVSVATEVKVVTATSP